MTDGLSTPPPDRAVRRLLGLLAWSAGLAALCFALVVLGWWAGVPDATGRSGAMLRTWVRTGAAGLALAPLLLLATAAVATRMTVRARGAGAAAGRSGRWAAAGRRVQAQEVVLPPLLLAVAGAAWWLAPLPVAPSPADAAIVAAAMLALAFPVLVAERSLRGLHPALLQEAPALRALALLCVLALTLAAAVALAVGFGQDWALWAAWAGDWLVGLVAVELALRVLGRWFVPPDRRSPRAAVTSLLAAMLAGSLGQGGMGAPIRAQLGLDFSRSWALRFLRRAAAPSLVVTAVLCWGLSGLVLLAIDRRGIDERLGRPVAVLGPGLHAVLPWPLGRVRPVEFGVVHEIALGGRGVADTMAAEAPPGPGADRLWGEAHPGEVAYLIASVSAAGGQGFQTVSADLRVLWRIGLADADALRAAYGTADPDALVRDAVGRQLVRFFAARTLDALLDGRREAMAETIRVAVAADLAPLASGIEVLAVVIEAVHPPAGAADAYHAVQAARIGALASVATERGRAGASANQSRQEAQRLTATAQASAVEGVETARAEAVRFDADRASAEAGGRAFLLERYLATVSTALARTPLTLIDHRLDAASAPLIDLRPLSRAAAPIAEEAD